MGEDSTKKRFGKDWARLTEDLRFDCDSSLRIKADLFSDIRTVIIPTLVDKVCVFTVYFRFAFSVGTFADVTSSPGIYIPIPRIEHTDNALALVVKNLTLSGRNLFPNVLPANADIHRAISHFMSCIEQRHSPMTLTHHCL